MKKALVFLVLLAVFFIGCKKTRIIEEDTAVVQTPTPIVKPGWTLAWHEEFDSAALDTAVWTAEDRKWPYSAEEEYYTPRPENIQFENGNLVFIALKENYNGALYTSGRIDTSAKLEKTYGYIEARIKCPYGKGIWPAFWMLMSNNAVPPPVYPTVYGEIDILEMVGGGNGYDNKVYGTTHWGDPADLVDGIMSSSGNTSLVWPQKLSDDYHIYAVEWTAAFTKYYFDGTLFMTVATNGATQAELQQPFYVILNLAVGGTWPGSPDTTTVWPQKMYVDWVRWWQI